MGQGLGVSDSGQEEAFGGDGNILCGGAGGRKPNAIMNIRATVGFPGGADDKEPICQHRRHETWI